ncbi:hypothetical protein KL935_001774 [Ogataea polymorpha]|nr:hypothetical protein KL935_001774 [Ogataea polymorpha]
MQKLMVLVQAGLDKFRDGLGAFLDGRLGDHIKHSLCAQYCLEPINVVSDLAQRGDCAIEKVDGVLQRRDGGLQVAGHRHEERAPPANAGRLLLAPKHSHEPHEPLTMPSLNPMLSDLALYAPSPYQNYNYANPQQEQRLRHAPASPTYHQNSHKAHKPSCMQINIRRSASLGHPSHKLGHEEPQVLCYDMESRMYKMVSQAAVESSNGLVRPVAESATEYSPWSGSGSPEKTKRSRRGCLTCRQRKKKCCETRPTCSECSRLMIRCRWPVPGSERKNRSKNNAISPDEMVHEAYGVIKILRGVVDYKVEG